MALFKKAAVMTDLHVGAKSNSIQHNEDCLQFVEWFIQKAKEENCETCLFLGDWHHHRANISILTLSYSVRILEKLNAAFDHVYMIAGNHDMYYREKRSVHSMEWTKNFPNITVIDDWFQDGDVVISPWLVGDDYKKLAKMSGKYLFGHLELPQFMMNALVEMPDHGEINVDHVKNFDTVFSGHFHKRQYRNNIWYIGNAFPHNYSDAGDDARGMMVLEWGHDPEFHAWPNQPRFRVSKLSQILENPATFLLPQSSVRVHLDVDISFEEATYLKETLIPQYSLREMSLLPMKDREIFKDNAQTAVKFESVDQIVLVELTNIESDYYDSKLLLDIFKTL